MRTRLFIGISLTALRLATVGRAQASVNAAALPAWLAGCWTQRSGDDVVDENWTAARGGAMIGISRTVTHDRMTEYEFVVIQAVGSDVEYRVRLGNRPDVVVFTAKSPLGTTIVFENPTHDFPKRIGYTRTSADALDAWIDGGASGGGRRISYAYKRAACPSS
jgi:hypothetical protein